MGHGGGSHKVVNFAGFPERVREAGNVTCGDLLSPAGKNRNCCGDWRPSALIVA